MVVEWERNDSTIIFTRFHSSILSYLKALRNTAIIYTSQRRTELVVAGVVAVVLERRPHHRDAEIVVEDATSIHYLQKNGYAFPSFPSSLPPERGMGSEESGPAIQARGHW